ncbi:MAG TPA: hypothetical protein HPP84_11810, partial [Rhodospirillaceae bacterium]|nr:hypothetical protein [Rhodospirillaceae bacterium]
MVRSSGGCDPTSHPRLHRGDGRGGSASGAGWPQALSTQRPAQGLSQRPSAAAACRHQHAPRSPGAGRPVRGKGRQGRGEPRLAQGEDRLGELAGSGLVGRGHRAAFTASRFSLDGTGVKARLDGRVMSIPLLVVIGVRRDGQKVLLAVKNMGGETEAAWRHVLEDLLARGLKAPELVIVDGGKGLEAALASLWSNIPVQRCTV